MQAVLRSFMMLAALLVVQTLSGADNDDKVDKAENTEKAVDFWISQTRSLDPATRENALRAIAHFGTAGRKAVPAILVLLMKADAEDGGVITNGVMALQTMDLPSMDKKEIKGVVTALTRSLQAGTTFARMQSAMALAQIGPEARFAIKPLVQHTIKENYSWELRKAGAVALGRVAYDAKNGPDSLVVNALANAVKTDACGQVRLEAILSLGMLGMPHVPADIETVKGALHAAATRKGQDLAVVIWSRALLAKLEPNTAAAHVTFISGQLQKSTDAGIRAHATQALSAIGGAAAKNVIPLLIDSLRDKESLVASAAGASLTQIKDQLDEQNLDTITKMLTDEELSTRCHAAQALGMLGDRANARIPKLVQMLKDKELVAAVAASAALTQPAIKEKLTVKELANIAGMVKDKELKLENRCAATQLLGALGATAKNHVPTLIDALEEKDLPLVSCAIVALAQMGKDAAEAVPALTKLKEHKEPGIKEQATRAIEAITAKPKKP